MSNTLIPPKSTRTGSTPYLNVLLTGALVIVVAGVVYDPLGKSPPATQPNQEDFSAKDSDEATAECEVISSPRGTATTHGRKLTPPVLYAHSRGAVATVVTKDDLGFDASLGSGFFVAASWVKSSYKGFGLRQRMADISQETFGSVHHIGCQGAPRTGH